MVSKIHRRPPPALPGFMWLRRCAGNRRPRQGGYAACEERGAAGSDLGFYSLTLVAAEDGRLYYRNQNIGFHTNDPSAGEMPALP